ncbi:MAG: hypothetical protein ACTHMM_04730 [Agriterribacter sp.]
MSDMTFHFRLSNSKKVLEVYYNVYMSSAFATCADQQLLNAFENITSIKVKDGVRLSWEQNDIFDYEKREVSKMTVWIYMRYGSTSAKIAWKSKSGRLYDIADEDIDCNDIELWFEGLDAEYCYKKMYPVWTLFVFPETMIRSFNRKHDLPVSVEFLECADKQLSPFFEKATGLKINKHISLDIAEDDHFAYVEDDISGLMMVLYVNHNWNRDITMVWKSKSGRIYKPGDTDIDCSDIEFGLEGIDPVLYYRQMYPKAELPFKLKNLSYQLVINRLNMDCTVEMKLKKEALANAEDLLKRIDSFIDQFNEKSVKKDREDGVVHNWRHHIDNNKLVYEIDTGFAGPALMKKLLPFLSSLNCFETVEIN